MASKQLKDPVKGLMNKPLEIKESPDKWEIITGFLTSNMTME